jgi:ankyrin repeat protein
MNKLKNGNTRIHLEILKQNINEIKKILNSKNKNKIINSQNNLGDTPLHLSIRYHFNDISKLLLEELNINLKIKNNYENDIFFEAILCENNFILELLLKHKNFNINSNFKSLNGITYFHQAIKQNNKIIFNYLKNRNNFTNFKDLNNNTLLHYAAYYERLEYIKLFLEFNFDLDQKNNFDENVLNYYLKSKKKNLKIIKLIISDVNSLDSNKNNCLIILLKNFKNLGNTLIKLFLKTKINLYHCNEDEISPLLQTILNNSYNNFLLLLNNIKDINYVSYKTNSIIHTYYYFKDSLNIKFLKKILQSGFDLNNININLNSSMHIICKNQKLNQEYLDLLIKYKGNFFTKNNVNKMSYDYIESKFQTYLNKNFFKKDCVNDINSCIKKIPKLKNEIKLLKKSKKIRTTFQGTPINEVMALIYLLKKHKHDCAPISSNIIDLSFSEYGLDYRKSSDTLRFYDEYVDDFKKCFNNKKINFIISPLRILDPETGGHANYLIFNKNTLEIERFEPYGSYMENNNLDLKLKDFFKDINKKIKYISPIEFCPNVGIQELQEIELELEKTQESIGDPLGFCSAWSIWYADLRLTNPNEKNSDLIKKAININKQKNNLTIFIRNYSNFIIEQRDLILKKNKISKLYEEQIGNNQMDKIIKAINLEVKKLIYKYT